MSSRHRLIWITVGVAHLTLMAGLVVVDSVLSGKSHTHSGNFVTISLVNDVSQELGSAAGHSLLIPREIFSGGGSAIVENKISLPLGLSVSSTVQPESSIYTPPVFLVRENPQYPREAMDEGRQGKVVVKIFISPQGKVESTQVIESSGSLLLDRAAELAASSSSFNPAERDHQPVSAEATATYRFELHD